MTPFFDDLERQLHDAATEVAARRRGRSRWRAGLRAAPVAGAIALSAVVAVVAVTALRHSNTSTSRTPPGTSQGAGGTPPQLPRFTHADFAIQKYLRRATAAVHAQEPECVPVPRRHPSSAFSTGSPPRSMLDAFAILRRPKTALDTPQGGMFHHGLPLARDVYARYVRRSQYRFGGGYYLVPAGDVVETSMPAHCYADLLAALRSEKIPSTLRTRAIRYQSQQNAWELYRQQHPAGLCLLHLNNQGYGGGGCGATTAEIEQGPGIGLSQGANGGGWIVSGIVPDGVATVSIRYPGGQPLPNSTRRSRPFTITVPVINNTVVFKEPAAASIGNDGTVVWRSANGAIVRTIHLQ